MRHVPPRRRQPAMARRRMKRGVALLVALLIVAPVPVAAAGETKPEAGFARFSAAWSARSTASVVGCVEPKGKVIFRLFAYPLSGKVHLMGPEQAKETMKIYFKRITSVALKDVTPKKSPKNVRLYEYTYKAARESPRTTHLQVKLKQDKKRLWVLASVTESAKPRK